MKMFVAHPGPLGPVQEEVLVQELIVHEGIYLALHRPAKVSSDGHYSMWIVSDFFSGFALSRSISKNYAIEKAKKLVSKNKDKIPNLQAKQVKRLASSPNYSIEFSLFELIRRKGRKRGFKPIEVINYR
ncbi:hypothetical protein [Lysinibacillus fusiformis]